MSELTLRNFIDSAEAVNAIAAREGSALSDTKKFERAVRACNRAFANESVFGSVITIEAPSLRLHQVNAPNGQRPGEYTASRVTCKVTGAATINTPLFGDFIAQEVGLKVEGVGIELDTGEYSELPGSWAIPVSTLDPLNVHTSVTSAEL